MQVAKAVIIFVLVLLADLAFTPQTAHVFNPQQVTRLALTWSLTEGRLDIDRFAEKTVDRAEFNGHAYADKPPGQSLLALPGVALAKLATGAADPLDVQNFAIYLTAAILTTNGLFGALAAALVYLLGRRMGAGERNALVAAAAIGLGTPFLGWSTVLFGHALSGSIVLIGFAIAAWGAASAGRGFAVGLAVGLLVVVDLTQAPAGAFVGLFYVLRGGSDWRRLPALVTGGVIGIAPLLIYNALAFGSPLHLGYSDVVGFEGMKQGLFGLTAPNPGVLLQILFGLYRGLLPLAPVLIVVPVGLAKLWRIDRGAAVAIAGIIGCALLINASYFYWDGGSATGPRHLVAMLPLACLSLAFVAPRSTWGRASLGVLLVLSVVISGICVSTEMLSGVEHSAPFFDDILPRFATAEGVKRVVPLLLPWVGFIGLFLWPERHKLAARPLDAAGEVELEQKRLHGADGQA